MQDVKYIRIKKNHRLSMPKTVIYFDTETYHRDEGKEQHHRMDFAWCCLVHYDPKGYPLDEKWTYHNQTYELCRYIEKCLISSKGLHLMGHNVFFDLQVSDFFRYFTRWGYRLDFYYEASLTYILHVVKDRNFLRCLSTTNWYDTNLAGLGRIIGLDKLDIDFEKDSRDTIVKNALDHYYRFIFDLNLGAFSPTKASQAYHAYRHRFMNVPIYCHNNDTVRKLERDSYYGGRVECFEIGEIKDGPFLYLDINSMYPYAMKHMQVPVKLINYAETYSIEKLACMLDKFSFVAEVVVETDEPAYALRYNGKIIFPIGTFITYLCSTGLKYAIDHNHLKRICRIAVYRQGSIFSGYIDELYPLKQHYTQTGETVMRELIKKMLNSLYGKFAQRQPIVHETVEETFDGYYREDIYNFITGEKGVLYKMFNVCVEQYGFEETNQTFTAISAHITESARFILWDIIKGVGYDNILYCDTDSVVIRTRDLDRVLYPIDDSALGALCIEKKVEKLVIYGPKSYIIDDVRKLKGIPKNAERLAENQYKYFTWLRQANHLRQRTDRWYILRETIKTLKNVYDKGKVLENGRVVPFTFQLDQSGVSVLSGNS
jgi:hypothetical protein